MSSTDCESASFAVIIPIKPPARGKSRLDALPDEQRRSLAEAFARDTVEAALGTASVTHVLVVSDDFRLAAELGELGCDVIPDGVSNDLNATLRQAAAEVGRRWPEATPVALCADLPCLAPADLQAALADVSGPTFVRDSAGTGTTMYAADVTDFAPAFGAGSADRHVALGVREILLAVPTLRLDVDDPGDLGRALARGVGSHTARATGRD